MDFTNESPQKLGHSWSSTPADTSFINNEIQITNNAYYITSKGSIIKYLHQCLFSEHQTLTKAIHNNQVPTCLGLTSQAVEMILPDSAPDTDKVYMKLTQQGICFTQLFRDGKILVGGFLLIF